MQQFTSKMTVDANSDVHRNLISSFIIPFAHGNMTFATKTFQTGTAKKERGNSNEISCNYLISPCISQLHALSSWEHSTKKLPLLN